MGLFGETRSTPAKTSASFSEGYLPSIQYQVAQSVGRARVDNEDALSAFSVQMLTSEARFSYGLFLIADGMGGHVNGEVASELAVRISSAHLTHLVFDPLRLGQKQFSDEDAQEALQKAVGAAHEAVLNQVEGGGTTLTIAMVINQTLHIAHVGDSRLYRYAPQAGFAQLTRDHSVVQRLTELGQISTLDAQTHPSRNVLFRALGQEDGFSVDVASEPLKEKTRLLLCSDGLWALVKEKKLLSALGQAPNEKTSAQQLVDMANVQGGTDNISVILVTIE